MQSQNEFAPPISKQKTSLVKIITQQAYLRRMASIFAAEETVRLMLSVKNKALNLKPSLEHLKILRGKSNSAEIFIRNGTPHF